MVGEWNLTGDAGKLCMKRKMPEGLFLKNGNGGTEYVMAGETVIGIKRQGLFIPAGWEPVGYRLGGHPAVCSGKWNRKDTGRYSGKGRTAGAVWAAGLSQSLSLPLLSKKSGGEILRKRGIENGFTE